MNISVVIPTFNEEKDIGDCLTFLAKQNLKDFEIIVVDDGSTDKTREVVENIQSSQPNIQIFIQKHKGPALARNLGAKHAKGDILVFVDADMTFAKNFLKELTRPIRAGKAIGTYSDEEFVNNWQNLWARCWNYNQGIRNKRRHKTGKKYLYQKTQVFRAIKKKDFLQVGGFDRGGYTDDYSLSKKLGDTNAQATKARIFHNNPETLTEIFEQAKWASKRTYKFGIVGNIYTILKSLLPISIVVGIYKAIFYKEPRFIIFKIIYDFSTILGIIEYKVKHKGAK